jgi:hypothetical protein
MKHLRNASCVVPSVKASVSFCAPDESFSPCTAGTVAYFFIFKKEATVYAVTDSWKTVFKEQP